MRAGLELPADKRPPRYVPLKKGEVRSALRDTRNVIGILGLRWAAIAKRAVLGGRR